MSLLKDGKIGINSKCPFWEFCMHDCPLDKNGVNESSKDVHCTAAKAYDTVEDDEPPSSFNKIQRTKPRRSEWE